MSVKSGSQLYEALQEDETESSEFGGEASAAVPQLKVQLASFEDYSAQAMDSSTDSSGSDDEDEEGTLLLQPGGRKAKTREPFSARCRRECCTVQGLLSQFTWERLKIILILATMALALWMFASEKESHDLGCQNLISVSLGHPEVEKLHTGEPLDVIEADLTIQKLNPNHPNTTRVHVHIQGCNKADGEDDCDWKIAAQEGWVTFTNWTISVDSEFQENNVISKQFELKDDEKKYDEYRMLYRSTVDEPLAMNSVVLQLNGIVEYEVIFAAIVLVGVYILIIFELVHRTIAALLGSFVALALVSKMRERPSLEQIVEWIDMDTIGLLFGMMVMVGIFSTTGFFEWSAIKAYKLAKGNLWRLTIFLCLFTAVVSAFLDNVTTVLLLTPVTIRLCKVLDVDPAPILLAEVMFSNIGGTATPIGDPPNVIIVNDKRIDSFDEVNFGQFTIHVAPGILIVAFVCYWLIKIQTKDKLKREPHQALLNEITTWKNTLKKMNQNLVTDEERQVRRMLQLHIRKLENQMRNNPQDNNVKAIDISELESKYRIRDRKLFASSCAVLGGVIIMFFIYSIIPIDINLAWIAIIGAMIHLVVAGIKDIEHILEKVEFGTLLFFAGLFILMESLEALGLIGWIADQVSDLVGTVDEGRGRLAAACTIIIWVSALVSAFIDNIPFTTAMVPVVYELATGNLNLPPGPLVWSLAYGTCLGGNGTLIGASANVVTVGLAEQEGVEISFVKFFKVGFPVMILSVICATAYILIFHVAIAWGWDDSIYDFK